MSLTGVQVAQLVTDHLINVYASNPDVSVERNYFPSMERGDYEKGKYKINVWPAALSSEAVGRGRAPGSRSLSRTIGVAVVSRAETTLDANDNDIFDQSVMDEFILFIEEVNDAVNGVEGLSLEDIEDADYMDGVTLEAEQLLATSINATYKEITE
jgi:hypothetical protein